MDSTEVVVVVGDLAVAVVEEVDLVVTEAVEAEVSAEDEVVETEEAETGQSHVATCNNALWKRSTQGLKQY